MNRKPCLIGSSFACNGNLLYRFRKKANIQIPDNNTDDIAANEVFENGKKTEINLQSNIYSHNDVTAKIFADSRYKLYINGEYVCEGPCIGSDKYYDEINVSAFIRCGNNDIEAIVFYAGGDEGASCIGRGRRVSFFMNVSIGENLLLETDESWDCAPDLSVEFFLSSEIHKNGYLNEKHKNITLKWEKAVRLNYVEGNAEWGVLPDPDIKKRPIKMYTPSAPIKMKISKTNIETAVGCENRIPITVKSGDKKYIVFELDKLSVGYPEFELSGCGDAVITYAESYSFENKDIGSSCYEFEKDKVYVKKIRSDSRGDIIGASDEILLDGSTSYRPFFTKCMRYVKLSITAHSDITIKKADFLEYRYPMNIENSFSCSDDIYNRIFRVSINTLRNCMFDTYVDCPYYEMQQYAEDTYLEMLYTFCLTSDYSMPRKAILDLWQSQNYEGMLLAAAPMTYRQITPTFCLFFIMMLEKYLLYTGDESTVLPMLASVYSILEWFSRYKNENGIIDVYKYGKFIDWVVGWKSGFSIDESEHKATSISNLMYLYALKVSSDLFHHFGKCGIAADIEKEYKNLKTAVNNVFYTSNNGMYADTVGGGYSEHSQIWAVLSGAISGNEAKNCIKASSAEYVHKCSYSYRYFRNRAYELLNIEPNIDEFLSDWKKMLELDATSWFEFPGNTRSDCHGWSAVPIYEFTSVVLGIKPRGIGISSVEISPSFGTLDSARGSLPTRHGNIFVEWHKINDDNAYHVCVKSPDNITKIIRDINGNSISVTDSVITYITK